MAQTMHVWHRRRAPDARRFCARRGGGALGGVLEFFLRFPHCPFVPSVVKSCWCWC